MDLAKLEALIDLMQRKGALYVKYEGCEVHLNPASVVPPDGIPVEIENSGGNLPPPEEEEDKPSPTGREVNPLLKNKKLWLHRERPKL